jgi:predicted Rossmann fold nucleotide-binding protein DprA/Smf involved in DNA uptake
MKKIAIVGSRYMSEYGKRVIRELMDFLNDKKVEVVTIRVMGCNSEIIKLGAKKIFEGKDFEKLNEQVAKYADILVVVEGGKNSGTILLASKFVEKNKDVYCVPGRITDVGSTATNWLIKQGANPLITMDDLTLVLQ